MENVGKRTLHAVFGFIVGLGAGYIATSRGLEEYRILCCIIGAVVFSIAAFFATDEFWEKLQEYLSWRH